MINLTLMFLNRWPLTFFDLYRSQKTKVLYFVYTKVIKGSGESFRQTDRQTDINSQPHYLRLWSPRRIRNASYYNPIKKVNSGINGMSFKTCLLKHRNCRGTQYSLQNSSEKFQREDIGGEWTLTTDVVPSPRQIT